MTFRDTVLDSCFCFYIRIPAYFTHSCLKYSILHVSYLSRHFYRRMMVLHKDMTSNSQGGKSKALGVYLQRITETSSKLQ